MKRAKKAKENKKEDVEENEKEEEIWTNQNPDRKATDETRASPTAILSHPLSP